MPILSKIPHHCNDKGSMGVIENLPHEVKRVYYIYDVPSSNTTRGGHSHKRNVQSLFCVKGSCVITCNESESFILDSPSKILTLFPEDWHQMTNFSSDAVLMVLASENYDPNDYVKENT